MTEISFSSSFLKAFKRKARTKPALEKRFREKLAIFRLNPFDPRLATHKLSGRLRGRWSFSIDYDVRVVFSFDESNRAVFADIGTHDEVY